MQSAMNALNPVDHDRRPVQGRDRGARQVHRRRDRSSGRSRCMQLVGIDPIHLKSYPHQLSGGMRQRAMIAMALLFTPDLVIMDEPTSALDVVAQRSLMVQIKELQRQLGFAVIFVTHDMSLVSHFSDQLLVMYAGQVVEIGPTRTVFDTPAHPYSRGLLDAFPSIRGPRVQLTGIPGSPPDLAAPPPGCRFQPRCPVASTDCARRRARALPGRSRPVAVPAARSPGDGSRASIEASEGGEQRDRASRAAARDPWASPSTSRSAAPSRASACTPSTTPTSSSGARRSSRWSARAAAARARSPGCSPGSTSRPAARSSTRAGRSPSLRAPQGAPGLPQRRADGVPGPVQLAQPGVPGLARHHARAQAAPARAEPAQRATEAERVVEAVGLHPGRRTSSTGTRTSSPAASGSGSASPRRWPTGRS